MDLNSVTQNNHEIITDSAIHVCVVDDDQLVAELLADFLMASKKIAGATTLGGTPNIEQAIQALPHPPNILLADIHMKNANGISLVQQIKAYFPSMKLILLSSQYQLQHTGFLVKMGFAAMLSKEVPKADVLSAICAVWKNDVCLTKAQLAALGKQVSPKAPKLPTHPKEVLTVREQEVLRLVCHQHTSKEIADKLCISTKTVEAHKSSIFLKTNVKNSAGLVIYAIQMEFINPADVPLYL